jgi:DNA polymerase III alpha subunit (gram-positive type)
MLQKIRKIYEQSKLQHEQIKKLLDNTYIVLDIETTKYGDMIQLSYCVYDINFNEIKSANKLINEGIGKTDYYEKFTLKTIEDHGQDPVDVLSELSCDMDNCFAIIGHNISFDMRIINKYFATYQIEHKSPKLICTMHSTKHLCKLKTIKGHLKFPKLSELYFYCFNCLPDESITHTADYDVEITFRCFKYLYDKKLINI